ncbi:PAS domain S-box protein [Anaerolineales bacterium HSG25]|nr:PAS domain S-box protein [Anaerolineales bacterium HSG25]
MSLRKKITLTISLTMIILVGLLYTVFYIVWLNSFKTHEVNEMAHQLQQIPAILTNNLEQLDNPAGTSGIIPYIKADMAVYNLSDDSLVLPPDVEVALEQLSSTNPQIMQFLSDDLIVGYRLITHADGEPAIILTLTNHRRAYKQGQYSLFYFGLILLGVGGIFVFVLNWLIEKQLLSRLTKLSQATTQISRSGDLSTRVTVTGNDELAHLGQEINLMLTTLENSTKQLKADVDHRAKVEQKLQRLNRTLKTISACNQALLDAKNEQEVMQKICQLIVEVGGYRLVWVGLSQDDATKTVRPVAQWGYEDGYLETLNVSWDENSPHGQGPTGLTIRNKKPNIVQHILTDPRFAPWREAATQRGYGSSIALPLLQNNRAFGALSVYATQPDSFDQAEVELLLELATDLARGLVILRTQIEYKHAETALRESEAQNRAIVNTAADGVITADEQGIIKSFNPAAEMIFGYRAEEVINKPLTLLMDEPHQSQHDQYIANYIRTGIQKVMGAGREVEGKRKNGDVVPLLLAISEATLDGKRLFTGIARDITQQKQVEQSLQEERNFIATVIDAVGTLVVVLTPTGKIVRFNRTCEEITGYQSNEVIGQTMWELFIRAEDQEQIKHIFTELKTDSFPYKNINYWLTKSGGYRLIDWTNTALLNADGMVDYIIASGIDITEQVEAEEIRSDLEEQLRQAQRMESIGRLAGGVAHDFNNQLTAMMGYASLALRRLEPDNPGRKDMEVILSSAERASHLTRQLLAFARRQKIDPIVVDLNEVITQVDKMLRRLIGENIEFVTLLDEHLGRIKADPGQLEQVLFNMVINSRDAMPEGGKLTIITQNVTITTDEANQFLDMKAGNYIRLKIIDTGMGMSDEVISMVFEPFFTTKEMGKGTGLGLATCFGIVKQNEGHIRVESEVGKGTTFTIDLPQFTAENPPQIDPHVLIFKHLPKGGETILLVEDEVAVRRMAADMLEKLGYIVLRASHGEEALRLFDNKTMPTVDLVITDVIMPKMSGRELARKLINMLPNPPKILFMSGYIGEAALGVNEIADKLLQKPFSLPQLAHKVRESIDE